MWFEGMGAFEGEVNRAADGVEASALAFRAGTADFVVEEGDGGVAVFWGGGVEGSMALAVGAPAFGGVPGKVFGFELGEGFTSVGIGALGGEPVEDVGLGVGKEAGAFAKEEGV